MAAGPHSALLWARVRQPLSAPVTAERNSGADWLAESYAGFQLRGFECHCRMHLRRVARSHIQSTQRSAAKLAALHLQPIFAFGQAGKPIVPITRGNCLRLSALGLVENDSRI